MRCDIRDRWAGYRVQHCSECWIRLAAEKRIIRQICLRDPMETLMLPFSPRFIVLTICAVVTGLLLGLGIVDRKVFDLVLIPMLIFGALTALGIRDLIQKSHAVLRNYPISAHLRFILAVSYTHLRAHE